MARRAIAKRANSGSFSKYAAIWSSPKYVSAVVTIGIVALPTLLPNFFFPFLFGAASIVLMRKKIATKVGETRIGRMNEKIF